MGMYDNLIIEEGVELPEFPDELDTSQLEWQTKDIRPPSLQTYKITSDGRLFRKEESYREKTDDEKQAEAEKYGFNSWDEYYEAVKDATLEETFDNDYPVGVPNEKVKEDEFWVDHNQHGSFEFHASSRNIEGYDIYWSYEARFTKGQLDEIVFLGDRHSGLPDDGENEREN